MVSDARRLLADFLEVEIEPDQYSPSAFRAFVDAMLARPESALETIGAAETLREISADADPRE